MKRASWRVQVVADVSCDIDGPVACTLRPSTIADRSTDTNLSRNQNVP